MSHFIVSIPSEVLRDSPPESKVNPLPMRATLRTARSSGLYSSWIRRGPFLEPCPTPRIPPIPMRRISSGSKTLMPIFASSATCLAMSAIFSGNSSPAGSFTRSRAKLVALEVVSPYEIPSVTSRSGASPAATCTSRRYFCPERSSDRYLSNR